MSSVLAEANENICVVCFKNVEIFSIGSCDHMVCYECSTRMRVLCRQKECPICRQKLPKVIFTSTIKPFNKIKNCSVLEDTKFKICFQNQKIQDAFYKLLEHNCSICSDISSFKTFQNLYDHMRNQHNLYYCDLCVDHLKVFSSERQCYTSKDLKKHREKGDVNDRSHRGHPLCQFCDVRYMDNDCLYRHLRRDHLYCHFCDADGLDLYYNSYEYLREHFQTEHYLCEEGTCIEEKFTQVFRTEIDLKAHRASVHGRSLGKAAAKQARTLELEFTLKPRPRQADNTRRGKSGQTEASFFEGAVGGEVNQNSKVNMPNLDSSEFPSLPSGSNSAPVVFPQQRGRHNGMAIQYVKRNGPLNMSEENFPVLGVGHELNQAKLNSNQNKSDKGKIGYSTSGSAPVSVSHKSNEGQKIKVRQDDFPSLSPLNKKQSNHQPNSTAVDWAKISNKKPEISSSSKPSSSTLAATKPSKFIGGEDFPCLHSKFNANLKLKANEPTKSDFVNIKTYKNNKGNLEKDQKVEVVSTLSENNNLDSSDILIAATSSKVKSKKKKSKINSAEEKSDTAKKKFSEKEVESLKFEEKSTKKSENSALNTAQSSETVLPKPLPKVEDWFGDLKKKSSSIVKGSSEEADGLNLISAYPFSEPGQSNLGLTNQISKVITPQQYITAKSSNYVNNDTISGDPSKKQNVFGNSETKKAPPPGFNAICSNSNSNESKRPPPGFSQNCAIVPKELTFADCSNQGLTFSEIKFSYMPPVNFEERNKKLVTKVNKIISNDLSLDQFREKSIRFRQNQLTAKEYFDQCAKAMDDKGLQEVFPELLILLPDIKKQQELFQVYSDSPSFSKSEKGLDICVTCHQVIGVSDVEQHFLNHSIEQNFPSLNADWTK